MNLHDKARKITTVIMDIDGTLTDGRLYFAENGVAMKAFNVRDGHGITLGKRAGLQFGVLSGLSSEANRIRCRALGMVFICEECHDKKQGILDIQRIHGLKPEECMYIGDDLVDLPPMRCCGVSVAVGDAVPELRKYADLCTEAAGGQGAVREAIEWLLKEQGKWESVIQRYFC